MNHFTLICVGYNCKRYIPKFYQSIYEQKYGNIDVYIHDDGSTDDGLNYLSKIKDNRIHISRTKGNYGAAFSRHLLIHNTKREDTIFVQLDMDDYLLPGALQKLDLIYSRNQRLQMSIGNYTSPFGNNRNRIYNSSIINQKTFRKSHNFNVPHLRSMRYQLMADMPRYIFKDERNKWYKYCTDVPLMLWPLYKCAGNEVFINYKPLYYYRTNRPNSTLAIAGKRKKMRRLKQIYKMFDDRYRNGTLFQ